MIIDCDVHQTLNDGRELLPYLPEPWKSEISKHGLRTITSGILEWEAGFRWDATPPSGVKPGSDPEFMKEQLLDKYNYSYAILTGGAIYDITGMPDPDYASAICSAYNDHTIAEWLPKDKRFKTVIWVAHQDPQAAAREIDRLGDHPDVVMVWFSALSRIPFGNKFFHPIYEAAQRKGLPIGIHLGYPGAMYAQSSPTAAGVARTFMEWDVCAPQIYMAHLTSILLEGVFVKYPELKILLVEGGFDWVPHLIARMDDKYKAFRQQAPWLKRLPSEYVADHVKFTTQPMSTLKEEHLLQIFDMIDAENMLMFASDYPHWDFDEPSILPKKLSETAKRKILHDNAANFLNLK
jgi:predicted TIM-barrel fold metal-dependent hydrolase